MNSKMITDRIRHWIHDTLIIVGVVTVAALLGVGQLLGYYIDLAFIPMSPREVRTAQNGR